MGQPVGAEHVAGLEVDIDAGRFAEVLLQRAEFEQVGVAAVGELYEYVEVAGCVRLAASAGAEDGELAHAVAGADFVHSLVP